MKKWLIVCLSVLLILTFNMPASAAHETIGFCTWELDGTHLTIFGNGKMSNYAYSCGPWGESITSVTIEDGVTSIGNYAFYGCSDLTSITIPDSVTTIGQNAFEGCVKLKSVTLPKDLKQLELRTFAECRGLETIVFPDSLITIGIAVFDNCNSLTEVTVPEGVTTIGSGAFVNCSNLRRVSLPDSVTIIAEDAFKEVPARMEKANCYQGVVYFGNHAIDHIDPDYENIHIREGTKSIADYAFDGSNRLNSIAIPDSVTTIGVNAFSRCNGLRNVYFAGDAEEQNLINISEGNTSLLNAAWHYGITKIPTVTTTTAKPSTSTEATSSTTETTTATNTTITDIPTEITTIPTSLTRKETKVADADANKHGSHGIVTGFVISIVIGIVFAALPIAAIVIAILMLRKKKK